jgi:hypothetical protein
MPGACLKAWVPGNIVPNLVEKVLILGIRQDAQDRVAGPQMFGEDFMRKNVVLNGHKRLSVA